MALKRPAILAINLYLDYLIANLQFMYLTAG